MRIALVIHPYYKKCKEPSKKRKAFDIYTRKKWLRMHKFSYRKSEIVKYEKEIRRKPDSEKPGIINKIIKNIKNIDRRDCGNLNKCVKRQSSKNSYGSKSALIFRDISFILPNLISLNLTSLGIPHPHILSYGLY
jgi:hypothetical protein